MNLEDIPAIDQHAHNLLKPEFAGADVFVSAFTESGHAELRDRHALRSLFYSRSMRDLGELLECEPKEEAILARRSELGFEALAAKCFQASNLSYVFLDDGFLPDRILPWEWHRELAPIRRVLRVERLAETLMESTANFDDFIARFRSEIDPPPEEVVAFKSIAAYRTGLDIQDTPEETARSHFNAVKDMSAGGPLRLADKPLIDRLVSIVMDAAAKRRTPVQFHTGFGDTDLDLRLANPLHLRRILEAPQWAKVPVVLLHAGYPYVREAGYLAAVYPQAHLDLGLAVPFLSMTGMRSVIGQALELAPTTKVMYSSDAHMIPELYYLAARRGRQALEDVLENAIKDSDLSVREADQAARSILNENARRLYLETDSSRRSGPPRKVFPKAC